MTATSLKSQILAAAAMTMAFVPAAAVLGLTPQASAQTAKPAATEVVYVGDVQTLEEARARIETAAHKLCQEIATRSPLLPREQSDCRHETAAQAMKQLDQSRKAIDLASAD